MQPEIRVEDFDEFPLVRPIGKAPAGLAAKHDPVAGVVDVVVAVATLAARFVMLMAFPEWRDASYAVNNVFNVSSKFVFFIKREPGVFFHFISSLS